MGRVIGKAVRRAGAEVEQRVTTEHVDHESARMHGIDHQRRAADQRLECERRAARRGDGVLGLEQDVAFQADERSEEHTSELQSPCNLVCRLLLEKKKKKRKQWHIES